MEAPRQRKRGSVVTFYSYKGGTGRTMALANTACLLAEREGGALGAVLVLDWDLEAPGLHRFFPPRLRTLDASLELGLDDQPGLIDLFIALADALPAADPVDDVQAHAAAVAALDAVPLERFVMPTEVGGVSILRAGRNDDQLYSRRVNTFDWEGLFRRAPGIYRLLAERLAQAFRWVLIDSRTGVTDISGICTALMPEKLVVVFTPNQQSLTGVRELVLRATSYRLDSDDLRPLLVYPLPSRIEASLERLSRQWRYGHPDAGIFGYQPMFQQLLAESYGLDRCDLQGYFDAVYIQQTPDCAYGEVISVREGGADRLSLASSYRVFVERLVSGLAPWESASAVKAAAETASAAPAPSPAGADLFAGPSADPLGDPFADLVAPLPPRASPLPRPPIDDPFRLGPAPTAHTGASVFVSWVPADQARVTPLIAALEARGHRVAWDRQLEARQSYTTIVTRALDASDVVLVCWSRASIESKQIEAEVVEGMRRGVLVPVLLDEVLPPLAFRTIQAVDLSRGDERGIARVVEAVEHIAARRPGDVVASLALPPSVDSAPPRPSTASPPSAAQAPDSVSTPRPRAGSKLPVVLGAAAALGLVLFWFFRQVDQGGPAIEPPRSSGSTPGLPPPAVAPTVPAQASPQRRVTVPQLVKLGSETAATAALSVGLQVEMVDADSGLAQPYLDGIVVGQSPVAASEAPAGSVVRLSVATKTVQVPSVNSLSLSEALARLRASGLELGTVDSIVDAGVRAGTVLHQDPGPGSRVPAGTRVNVGVAAAPAPSIERKVPYRPAAK